MDKDRKEAIDFLVRFANMNLNELKPGDKAKLLVESEEHLFLKGSSLHELFRSASMGNTNIFTSIMGLREDIALGYRRMKWAFKPSPEKDSAEYWSMLLHLQKVIKEMLSGFAQGEIPFHLAFLALVGWDSGKKVFLPLSGNLDNYLRFKIAYLLFDSPHPASVQICLAPKCHNFFINMSLRKKRFCSPRCMWRFNTTERRKHLKEEEPEKYRTYLDKQRELMAKKYEKDVHARYPKAKVSRRVKKT